MNFLNLVCLTNLSLNLKLNVTQFEYLIPEGDIYLIELASFYGSLEIFKYLLINNVILTPRSIEMLFKNGNIEMIRLININPFDIISDKLINILLSYRNYELFLWLNEYNIVESFNLNNCIENNDIWGLLYFLSKNNNNLNKEISLFSCLKNSYLSILNFLFENDYNINQLEKIPVRTFYESNWSIFNRLHEISQIFTINEDFFSTILNISITDYPYYITEFLLNYNPNIFDYNSKCLSSFHNSQRSLNQNMNDRFLNIKLLIDDIFQNIQENNLERLNFLLNNNSNKINCYNQIIIFYLLIWKNSITFFM